jgi:cysteine-rich repeat protein
MKKIRFCLQSVVCLLLMSLFSCNQGGKNRSAAPANAFETTETPPAAGPEDNSLGNGVTSWNQPQPTSLPSPSAQPLDAWWSGFFPGGAPPEIVGQSPVPPPGASPPPPIVPPVEDDFFNTDFLFREPTAYCGNKRVERGEQCDDGNDDPLDGCAYCLLPECGNYILEENEQCDDGNRDSGDGCNENCNFEGCGNMCLDKGEQCDDGNFEAGDGCSPCCMFEICGNGVIDPGEQCDNGEGACTGDPETEVCTGNGYDRICTTLCLLEICGNRTVTPNEQCDDGNHINGDGCSSECQLEVLKVH